MRVDATSAQYKAVKGVILSWVSLIYGMEYRLECGMEWWNGMMLLIPSIIYIMKQLQFSETYMSVQENCSVLALFYLASAHKIHIVKCGFWT